MFYIAVCLLMIITHNIQAETCKEYITRLKGIEGGSIKAYSNRMRIFAEVLPNNHNRVSFRCTHDYFLKGNKQLTCYNNATWSAKVPKCFKQCQDLSSIENMQITTENRTENATVQLSCLPGYKLKCPDTLHCKHGGSWHHNYKIIDIEDIRCNFQLSSIKWKLYLTIAGSVALATIIIIIFLSVCIWTRQKHGKDIDDEVKRNPDVLDSLFAVKVWNADREKKKLLVVHDMKSLKRSVCFEFGYDGRIVLEEDGTEVEDDSALFKYKEKTLMALKRKEYWLNSRWRTYNHRESEAFHVFMYNREKSVMILGHSLEDLCEQAKYMLGYRPNYICLEEDGTVLSSDRELMAFAGSRIMAIKTGFKWTSSNITNSAENTRYSSGQEKLMFNVWSQDGRKRKVVFATNIVDLHFAAARSLGLYPPVEITTINGDHVSDETSLRDHVNDVLVVKEIPRQQRVYLDNDTIRAASVYSA